MMMMVVWVMWFSGGIGVDSVVGDDQCGLCYTKISLLNLSTEFKSVVYYACDWYLKMVCVTD